MSPDLKHLRNTDVRAVYQLLGECCELGADPLVWRHHMLTQFNQLLGCTASVDIEATLVPTSAGMALRPSFALSPGGYSNTETTVLTKCLREMPIEDNPLVSALLQNSSGSEARVGHRRGWVGDRAWERCGFVRDYLSHINWNDTLLGILPPQRGIRVFTLTREKKDVHFTPRDASVLSLFLNELATISEVRLSAVGGGSLMNLPPRMREVLMAMSDGDNEKQIAMRLSISRNTVHEYARRLFSRYGVSSRAELLLRTARQLHALSLANDHGDIQALHFSEKNR